MKCQFGYRKVRYRGIAKNGAQVFALLALANLFFAPRDTRVRMTNAGAKASCEGRNTAGTSIDDENPAPPSTHCEKVTLLRGSLASGQQESYLVSLLFNV
jgi:hypothetical protein